MILQEIADYSLVSATLTDRNTTYLYHKLQQEIKNRIIFSGIYWEGIVSISEFQISILLFRLHKTEFVFLKMGNAGQYFRLAILKTILEKVIVVVPMN